MDDKATMSESLRQAEARLRAALEAGPTAWMSQGFPQIVTDEWKQENLQWYPWVADYKQPLFALNPEAIALLLKALDEARLEQERLREIAREAADAATRLQAEVLEARRDAERYRWLRNNASIKTAHIVTPDGIRHFSISADETIDTAMIK